MTSRKTRTNDQMRALGTKLCRQLAAILMCMVDVVWLLANHVTVKLRLKKRPIVILLLFLIFIIIIIWYFSNGYSRIQELENYSPWRPSPSYSKPQRSKVFVQGAHDDIYMYSAIANFHQPYNERLNIIITSLDKSRGSLMCCVLMDNSTVYTTTASEYFIFHKKKLSFVSWMTQYRDPNVYFARQHWCTVPHTGHVASHVTLTSKSCSTELSDYVQIVYPPLVPFGLALCAKIAHSGGIDPEKFIEWMEVQRIQGVDKVLIFDLGNPESLNRVFRYYQELGVLDVHPYDLPGLPRGRTLMEKDKHNHQFHHDETMSVLECRQRMGGYTYVLSHDVDEFIIPREDVDLKTFFKKHMEAHRDAAGFFFNTQFFIYDWGPTNPEEDLMVTRYRKSTFPHWECTKYVYLPSRTVSSVTHDIYPRRSFTTYRIPPQEAVLHHYRKCPGDTWGSCSPNTMVDHVMVRFPQKHGLYERVKAVRQATNTTTHWTVSKDSGTT